jgi:hypothetical protein
MSILSQLFSPADLQRLDESKLAILRATIRGLFNPSLDTTRNTTVNNRDRVTQPFIDAILERARNACQQLGLDLPINTGPFEFSRPLFLQLFNAENLDTIPPFKREILETTISCEVINFNFYDHLLTIQEVAYETYSILTGQGPGGPTTFYSPFNLNSPMHSILNPDTWPHP